MFATRQENVKRELKDEILDRRLDYARFLLTQTTVPLEKVAVYCGWRNEKNFAAAFESKIGVTPARYRGWHQC